MTNWLLVAAGGGVGACLRYAVALLLVPTASGLVYPWHTLIVNWGGAAIIGLGWGLWQYSEWFLNWGRPFLFVGILGGFTTFSAFSLECLQLMEQDRPLAAMLYVAASVVGSLCLVWGGRQLGLSFS